jgi:hypothetical protein
MAGRLADAGNSHMSSRRSGSESSRSGRSPHTPPAVAGSQAGRLFFPAPPEDTDANQPPHRPGRDKPDALDRRRKPDKPGKPGKPDEDLDRRCRQLLAELEKYCPDLLPTGPLPPGDVADPIDIQQKDLERLVLSAVGVEDKRGRHQVIWEQAGSELLVHLERTRLAVLEGLVLVGLTVETVETGRVEVTVPFAVGRPERLAGMVVTSDTQPRGPVIVVDRWGDALIAAAWQALVDVISTIAARTGVDEDGAPLLPGAIVATEGRLSVIPQAGHLFEHSAP